ncbi:MAG: long-chain fatty acid--CoA ligase [SAR324 cluster bacterium]|nr:long-chain fatty acid--CoA ligase [SAR324 cluster bacterium]
MNIASFLKKSATTFGTRPALSMGTKQIADYRFFADQVSRLAAGLRHTLGLNPGDRCAIGMTNTPEFMIVLFACWHANLIAVPMNAKLHRKEFAYILENSGTRQCFINDPMKSVFEGLPQEISTLEGIVSITEDKYQDLYENEALPMIESDPDDPAWLFYTSGTTGQPKGATLTHRNLVAMTMSFLADIDSISEHECIIHAAPMSHGSGIYGIPYVARGANQVVPQSGHFDPLEVFDLIQNYQGSSFFFAPTMIVRLLNSTALEKADLTNLRTIIYGGGPMYVSDLLQGLDKMGPKFVQIYGQGEVPMTITYLSRAMHGENNHPRFKERLGSVGIARTDVEVQIVDQEGNPIPTGEIGEIVVRGDVVMKGYWQNLEATQKALKDGWLHTGDLGVMDGEGFITLKDRSKDLIISGGANIYPREVEEVLLNHPDVLEVSVIGKPHPEWGEEVVAFVVPKNDQIPSDSDLDQLCLNNIARFKRPKHYYFLESLPKNNYGKVLKTELRIKIESE